jgi:hypothetical protein
LQKTAATLDSCFVGILQLLTKTIIQPFTIVFSGKNAGFADAARLVRKLESSGHPCDRISPKKGISKTISTKSLIPMEATGMIGYDYT